MKRALFIGLAFLSGAAVTALFWPPWYEMAPVIPLSERFVRAAMAVAPGIVVTAVGLELLAGLPLVSWFATWSDGHVTRPRAQHPRVAKLYTAITRVPDWLGFVLLMTPAGLAWYIGRELTGNGAIWGLPVLGLTVFALVLIERFGAPARHRTGLITDEEFAALADLLPRGTTPPAPQSRAPPSPPGAKLYANVDREHREHGDEDPLEYRPR